MSDDFEMLEDAAAYEADCAHDNHSMVDFAKHLKKNMKQTDKPKGPPSLADVGVQVNAQYLAITKVLEKRRPEFFEGHARILGTAIVIHDLGDDLWDEPMPMQTAIVIKVIGLMDAMAQATASQLVDAAVPENSTGFWKAFVKSRITKVE